MPARRAPREGRVALVTHAALPSLSDDDRLLLEPLARRGLRGEPVRWDDAGVDWAAFDAVVVRSCWDYHLRGGEFRAWVDRLEACGANVWNPPAVLRWNADKRYLRALAEAGVRTVPTRWIESPDPAPLAALLEEAGWDDAVVKPAVSASAHETWRTSRARAATEDGRFRALAARGAVMVQPFVPAVVAAGEWSVLFAGGAYSHAVLKRPRAGDFRVQREHGGTAAAAVPADEVIDAAARALAGAPAACRYARVDGCVVDGAFVLMELEVLEPSLFLASDAGAAERFADAIAAAVREPVHDGAREW